MAGSRLAFAAVMCHPSSAGRGGGRGRLSVDRPRRARGVACFSHVRRLSHLARGGGGGGGSSVMVRGMALTAVVLLLSEV